MCKPAKNILRDKTRMKTQITYSSDSTEVKLRLSQTDENRI